MAENFDEIAGSVFGAVESAMGQDAYQASVKQADATAEAMTTVANATAAHLSAKATLLASLTLAVFVGCCIAVAFTVSALWP
jgi:hypothetical protein